MRGVGVLETRRRRRRIIFYSQLKPSHPRAYLAIIHTVCMYLNPFLVSLEEEVRYSVRRRRRRIHNGRGISRCYEKRTTHGSELRRRRRRRRFFSMLNIRIDQ